jgi:hypothetical protein
MVVAAAGIAVLGCMQGPWSTTLDSSRLSGGAIEHLTYGSPGDTTRIHVAFVATDTALCGQRSSTRDNFPANEDFEFRHSWEPCASVSGDATDSVTVMLHGRAGVVTLGQARAATGGNDAMILVLYAGRGHATIRRVDTVDDLKVVPAPSRAELARFFVDSLKSWRPREPIGARTDRG